MNSRDDKVTAFTACRLVDGTTMIARLGHPHSPGATGGRSSRPGQAPPGGIEAPAQDRGRIPCDPGAGGACTEDRRASSVFGADMSPEGPASGRLDEGVNWLNPRSKRREASTRNVLPPARDRGIDKVCGGDGHDSASRDDALILPRTACQVQNALPVLVVC